MQHLITQYGYVAVFLLMLAESACIPIPSEVIMLFGGALAAGAYPGAHPTLIGIVLAGVLGNVAGSYIAWAVGRYAGQPAVRRWGRRSECAATTSTAPPPGSTGTARPRCCSAGWCPWCAPSSRCPPGSLACPRAGSACSPRSAASRGRRPSASPATPWAPTGSTSPTTSTVHLRHRGHRRGRAGGRGGPVLPPPRGRRRRERAGRDGHAGSVRPSPLGQPAQPGAVRVSVGDRSRAVLGQREMPLLLAVRGGAWQDLGGLVRKPDGAERPDEFGELPALPRRDVRQHGRVVDDEGRVWRRLAGEAGEVGEQVPRYTADGSRRAASMAAVSRS